MTTDLDVLHRHVLGTVGDSLERWPGGWPDDVEAALIDAVFSVRARYGSRERLTGVYGAVVRWQKSRGEGHGDDLRVLASTSERHLRTLTNSGKINGRYKAAVVIDAAQALIQVGVVHASDFPERLPQARAAYLSVTGCGPVTWAYFRMLLGLQDVKPDTWVMRFVQDCLPLVQSPKIASDLIVGVAARMDLSATVLDHAIWRHRRTNRPEQATA